MPTKGIFPYYVSGPLSRPDELENDPEGRLYAMIDAFMHVACWIAIWVIEIMLVAEDKGDLTSKLHMATLVVLGIATFSLLAGVVVHQCSADGIQEGKYAPFMQAMITSGLRTCMIFVIISTFVNNDSTLTENWRTLNIVLVVLLSYTWSVMLNNLRYAGPAEDMKKLPSEY